MNRMPSTTSHYRIDTEQSLNGRYRQSDHSLPPNNTLEYRHRCLQHDYASLEKEFQLYSSETYNKIAGLEKDMDRLVEQKDRSYRTLSLENYNLKQENISLKNEINELKVQIGRLTEQVDNQILQAKHTDLSIKQIESMYQDKIMKMEQELHMKICQLESIKQALNNQRINCISKDQLIRTRENQISRLCAELINLNSEIQNSLKEEQAMKDTNYRLRRQVQELKNMFSEMEAELRNCGSCASLKAKNEELYVLVQQLEAAARYRKAEQSSQHKSLYYIASRNQKRGNNLRRQLQQMSFNIGRPRPRQTKAKSNVKESILSRCRTIIEGS